MAAISTVQIDIADFLLHVLETPVEDRGEWVTQFARSLAKRDLEGHSYACKCLLEVEEFRKREADRKAALKNSRSKDSADSKESGDSVRSGDSLYIQPDNQSNNHLNKEKKAPLGAWFSDAAFSAAWRTWEKERKKKGTALNYSKLEKLSGGDIGKAILILNESASNGWAGLFPLKNFGSQKPPRSRGEHVETLHL